MDLRLDEDEEEQTGDQEHVRVCNVDLESYPVGEVEYGQRSGEVDQVIVPEERVKPGGLGEDDGYYRDDEEGGFSPALYPLLSSQVGEDEYELEDGEERHGQEPDLQQKDLEPERRRHQVECVRDGQEGGKQQQESEGPGHCYVAVLVAIERKGDEHPPGKEEESDQEGRYHGRGSLILGVLSRLTDL